MTRAEPAWSVPSARSLRELAFRQVDQVILGEIERARPRLRAVREASPGASRAEMMEALVHRKRSYAGTGGLVSGIFGLVSVPLDLVMVTYLQISVVVDVALLHGVNLKSRSAQREVLEVVARGNGVSPFVRGSTPLLARVALGLLKRRGWPSLGRAMPLLAMPVCAWMNSRDIERVGLAAHRHYEGLATLAARRGRREQVR